MKFLVNETHIKVGKNAEPSCALIDSQSVKTAYRDTTVTFSENRKKQIHETDLR